MMDLGDLLCSVDWRCVIKLQLISKDVKMTLTLDLYKTSDHDWENGCHLIYNDGKYIYLPRSVINMPVYYFYPAVEYNVINVYVGSTFQEYDFSEIKTGKIKRKCTEKR